MEPLVLGENSSVDLLSTDINRALHTRPRMWSHWQSGKESGLLRYIDV